MRGRWRDHGCVFDGVEELAAEVVHARGELAETGGELVVADDGRDGDDEAGGGGDEGLRDAGGDGAKGRCACGAQAVEGVDDAHDGAEEADERRDGGDGGEPGHAALHRGEGFARGGLGGAFERDGIAWQPRPPFCRWYSSWISLKTATRGLGLNCSATAAISLSRVDLRKARTKRRLCVWALPKRDHLEIMMAQEKMLASRRMTSTAKATGPLL